MQRELAELLNGFAQRPTGQDRDLLTEQLGELCFGYGVKLSERERDHVYIILRALLSEAQASSRSKVAEHLSGRDDVPHDVILMLVEDEIEVAYPILTWSQQITDDVLLNVIANNSPEHKMAIAGRASLSAAISDALAASDENETIIALLQNGGAELSDELYKRLISESMWIAEYRDLIIERQDLDRKYAGRVYVWANEEQRRHLRDRFKFESSEMENLIAGSLSEAMEADAESEEGNERGAVRFMSDSRIRRAADQLMDFLRDDNLERFKLSFVQMSGLQPSVVDLAFHQTGYAGIAVLCKGAGFDRTIISEAYFHLHGGRENAMFRTTEEYKKAVNYFDTIDRKRARRVIEAWQDAAGPGDVEAAADLINKQLAQYD